MTKPTVSVIIPSFDRPELLQRAISSCLSGAYADETEVIVIPNGTSTSWRTVKAIYSGDQRVTFAHSPIPDQNNARNLGLELSRGELIRFLDDDDYLFPHEADRQYRLMLDTDLDFSSAGAVLEDSSGNLLKTLHQPHTELPELAVFSTNRLQLPFTHVYRRSSIGELRWPVGIKQSEDIVWLIRYVAAAPRRWDRMDVAVGAWYQHPGYRQSFDRPAGSIHKVAAQALLETHPSLVQQNRWTNEISLAVSEALWDLVSRAFPFQPIYWSKLAKHAQQLNPKAQPTHGIYQLTTAYSFNPLLLMWLILPVRLAKIAFTLSRGALLGHDYRRTL